jgi:Rv2525c-like, glycoside hydrolase-like domain
MDYSWARPSPQSLVDYPSIGVMRYIGPGNGGRDLTVTEAESLWAVGLGVGLVWETSANRALQGYDAGAYDASQADYYAARLGAPDDVPIYYACDCDVDYHETWGVVLDYFAGTLCSCHSARCYGEADVIDMTFETFGMRHGWQPAASSWSGGRLSPNAGMWQKWPYVMNDQCDENDVLIPNDQIDWLWGGGDMGLSTDDLHQIKNMMTEVVNSALASNYTGARALKDPDDPTEYELVVKQGDVCRRGIPSSGQAAMLKWVDHLAGKPTDQPRVVPPEHLDAFRELPVVGS